MIRGFVLMSGLMLASAGIVFLLWLLWILWKPKTVEPEPPAIEIGSSGTGREIEIAARVGTVVTPAQTVVTIEKPDDLKRIEGIGPKIASVLHEAGIATFDQLAQTDASHLEKILTEADSRLLRLADPTSWPEQATLAAANEWKALGAFQNELKAGRRAR